MDDQFMTFLKEEGLRLDTKLYRSTWPEFLVTDAGEHWIQANEQPTEMVIDSYGSGHTMMASEVGRGLAFTEEMEDDYKLEGRIYVIVRLQDVKEQGGRIYKDVSSHVLNSYFLYLPEGRIQVSILR
jgi:hypothetical protein